MVIHEYKDEQEFKRACRIAAETDLQVEIFTPVGDEKLETQMGIRTRTLGVLTLLGGVAGIALAALITYIPSVITYPINIGGRPLNSWPAFAIIAFELGVLFAAFAVVGGLFWMNHWPAFDRSIFQLKEFDEKRTDHYFIVTQKEITDARSLATYHLDVPD